MAYQDFEQTFEELRAPIQRLSGLYAEAGRAVDTAAAIHSDGTVAVDYGALREALSLFPEGNDERFDRATAGLGHGFAMLDGEPLLPWSALMDAQAVRPLGQEFWRALGFNRDSTAAFHGMEHVPSEVTASGNMAMLQLLASKAPNYVELAPDPVTDRVPSWAAQVLYLSPALLSSTAVPSADDTSTTSLALKPEDFKTSIECLQKARYQLVHFGFNLEICLDSACADALEELLSFGVGSLFSVGGALLTKGLTAAGAAVAAVGGWVAFFIMISAAYWALMIHLNKTPRGVCLYIPMPWTFGLIGPGWAVGR